MDEITRLREQVAALTKELNECKWLKVNSTEHNIALMDQLTAAQATNARLRGYIQRIVDDACQWDTNYPRYLNEALALPNDSTELDARLEQAKVEALRDAASEAECLADNEMLLRKAHKIEKGE